MENVRLPRGLVRRWPTCPFLKLDERLDEEKEDVKGCIISPSSFIDPSIAVVRRRIFFRLLNAVELFLLGRGQGQYCFWRN